MSFRYDVVVIIKEMHEVSGCVRPDKIGRCRVGSRVAEIAQPRIAESGTGDIPGRPVRAIVCHENFQRYAGLPQHAGDRLGELFRPPVRRNDDRDVDQVPASPTTSASAR